MPVIHSHRWPCALTMVMLLPLTAISCSYRMEVPAKGKIGFPRDYRPGAVETRFQTDLSLWVVHDGRKIYALQAVCPQEGCRPNWLESAQQFKCPCCGSAFGKDGTTLKGPAPRSLERVAIALAHDGQLEIDKGRTFRKESGQWDDPASYVAAGGGGVPRSSR
jgi:cytochrome b6-f complex iron-sulfur subunit